jgi:hypothetical protein
MHRLVLVGGLAFILTGATPLAGQQASQTRPAGPRAAGAPSAPPAPWRAAMPPVLPGTTERAFSTIQGNALDSANSALPNGIVRLRDVRFGRIVDLQVTDQSGLFTFRTVDPGSYVVELIGASESVMAASQVLHASAGDVVSAVVKLPFRAPPLSAMFGETSQAGALAMLVSTAASSGILSVVAPGTPVSPQ